MILPTVRSAIAGQMREEIGPLPSTPSEQGAALLRPFGESIQAAKRLRIAAYGQTRLIDFHAALWRGAPLIDHAPVSYALDLPRPPARPSRSPSSRFESALRAPPA